MLVSIISTCLRRHEVRRADAPAVDGLRLVLQLGGQLDGHAEPAQLHGRRVLLAAMRHWERMITLSNIVGLSWETIVSSFYCAAETIPLE